LHSVCTAYERRDRIPRLEFLPAVAPAAEAALAAGGFALEATTAPGASTRARAPGRARRCCT